MYVIREIMYCQPGKVRALSEKFLIMSKLSERMGMPKMRVMTGSEADRKAMEKAMDGYHELVDHGKREIYKLESE